MKNSANTPAVITTTWVWTHDENHGIDGWLKDGDEGFDVVYVGNDANGRPVDHSDLMTHDILAPHKGDNGYVGEIYAQGTEYFMRARNGGSRITTKGIEQAIGSTIEMIPGWDEEDGLEVVWDYIGEVELDDAKVYRCFKQVADNVASSYPDLFDGSDLAESLKASIAKIATLSARKSLAEYKGEYNLQDAYYYTHAALRQALIELDYDLEDLGMIEKPYGFTITVEVNAARDEVTVTPDPAFMAELQADYDNWNDDDDNDNDDDE